MLIRIEVATYPHMDDTVGRKVARSIHEALGIAVQDVRTVKVFTLEGFSQKDAQTLLDTTALHDPVLHVASLAQLPSQADWIIEVGFKPGVTDNEGRTARDTAALVLHATDRDAYKVYTSTQYHLTGALAKADVERIVNELLANELIQRTVIKSQTEFAASPFEARAAKVTGAVSDHVAIIPLSSMSDAELVAFSQANTLALSLTEMNIIKAHFTNPEVVKARKSMNLPGDPTDAEMEMLAQTWSEHCKHKIFASKITYHDSEAGTTEVINSVYKTTIQNITKKIRTALGDKDFCRSVFKDNAGVVAFNETHDACIKVETHNSPSALDPYGGALTGIVGVNRDPMGTGLGAELVCNTDVFCFASPFYNDTLPPRLLHPRRVMEGVREGVEHGGNKSGIPTVNGSIVFDERFLGKPLVYCGTVGIIPRKINGRNGYEKKALPGDTIVMVGGRIGKDGIHGATFSSEELHENSPATAVQIGDPITQRKMYDFIMKARDAGLYNAITDNGAGGLSSSVGEMAEDTGGCRFDVSKAPLKYDGLHPWEIVLSEAQERMTLAVPADKLQPLLDLAKHMDVEATPLGEFTSSGYIHITCGEKPVTWLSMDFLHNGLAQMELSAVWKKPTPNTPDTPLDTVDVSQEELLQRMLGRLNICSKEYLIRQYDHEVRGGSVVKPLTGVKQDGPSDAGVIRPLLDSEAGLVISHGICPKFSEYDTYLMTANAVDEALRNAVAVGADPDRSAGVDNFCWCDPILSEKNPDGEYKLAQLVRSCKALADYCMDFGVPCVSGKDSMKNDYTGGGVKISIPPTLLFSVLSVMDDVNMAVTSDVKAEGDAIYIVGNTARELGGSELASELGLNFHTAPAVDSKTALAAYRAVHKAMLDRLVSACHDLSDGGLAVAVAEMAIGGRLGAKIDLNNLPVTEALSPVECLYSESASRLLLTVAPEHKAAFEKLVPQAVCLGIVTKEPILHVTNNNTTVLQESVETLAKAFKATLDW